MKPKMQSAIKKIVLNDASRWALEKDLIEAIIALPIELFYNTEIATYIWVLSKNKRPERKGKIQLIDASNIYHKLRKALGKKKNEISPDDRTVITKLYADFVDNEDSRIFKNEDFIYKEYVVMQPLQRRQTACDGTETHCSLNSSATSLVGSSTTGTVIADTLFSLGLFRVSCILKV